MTIKQRLEQIFGISFEPKKTLIELRQFHSNNNNAFCCDESGNLIGLCACENDWTELALPKDPLLQNLQYLNLSDNEALESLTFEGPLPDLEHLDLSDCKLQTLKLQEGFNALRWLDISRNKLKQLVTKDAFPKMQYLDLSGNQLKDFSTNRLDNFPNLKGLYLKGNPLVESKRSYVEASGNNLPFLKRFHKQLQAGQETNNEYKIILVGNGGVGKTCLVEQLIHNEFEKRHLSTEGISLQQYHKEDFPYILNLWDFGGQDIYHATHRLFMQSNAIYLLLWDEETRQKAADEENQNEGWANQDLTYWLDIIHRNEEKTPVFIIKTKAKDNDREHPERSSIHDQFHDPEKMPIEWLQIDSKVDDDDENPYGYKKLKALLEITIEEIKRNEQIPTTWGNLRRHMRSLLNKEQKKAITLNEFLAKSEDYGIKEGLEVLKNWLVPSGVVFYRAGYFKDAVIINQGWAIEAIYTIFNREKGIYKLIEGQKGRFTGKELGNYWKMADKDYSPPEQELLVNFMLGCEMCFEMNQGKNDDGYRYSSFEDRLFVVPELLPTKTPDSVSVFKRRQDLIYIQYRARYLHRGIIQRFIINTQYLAAEEGIWRNGILLFEKGTNALVQTEDQRITVLIPHNGFELLDKIRNLIDKLEPQEMEIWYSLNGKDYIPHNTLLKSPNDTIETDTGLWLPNKDFQLFLNRNQQKTFKPSNPSLSNENLIKQINLEEEHLVSTSNEAANFIFDKRPFRFLFLAANPIGTKKIKLAG